MSQMVQTSENFLDFDEKNLKKLILFAKEKLKHQDSDRYQVLMKTIASYPP